MVRIWAWWRPNTFSIASEIHRRWRRAGRIDGQSHQVVVQVRTAGLARRPGEVGQRGVHRGLIAVGTQTRELVQLFGTHLWSCRPEDVDLLVLRGTVLVDADERLVTGVDPGLGARRRLLDAQLRQALVDGLCHAAGLFDLGNVRPSSFGELRGEPFDVVRKPATDRSGASSQTPAAGRLRIAGDARGEVGRQRDRLVECVGMQRLRVPWVAAIASTQVRATLLNTSWAVSDQPGSVNACAVTCSWPTWIGLRDQLTPDQARRASATSM